MQQQNTMKMKIKWEKNSRVLNLAAQGKIHPDDIVGRSRTDELLDEVATVRMHKVREKDPFVTVHIRGKHKTHTRGSGMTWNYASVCRVNFGGPHTNTMCSNGDLDEDYTWQDVHSVVEKVKEVIA